MDARLNDALQVVRSMSAAATLECGYVLAPYGSTITKGSGRDIDLFAVPCAPLNDYTSLLSLFSRHGFMQIGERGFSPTGSCLVLLRHRTGGPIIDLSIREATRTERERQHFARLMAWGLECRYGAVPAKRRACCSRVSSTGSPA